MIERGYCDTAEGAMWLAMSGLPPNHIYCSGRGAETFKACVSSFRMRGGSLYVTCTTPRPPRNIKIVRMKISDVLGALIKAKNLRRIFAAIT